MKRLKIYLDNCCFNRPYVIAEPFDYTKWREDLFEGLTVRELSAMAQKAYNEKDGSGD